LYSESLLLLPLLLDPDDEEDLDLLLDLDFLFFDDLFTLFFCFDFLSPELEELNQNIIYILRKQQRSKDSGNQKVEIRKWKLKLQLKLD
jgi:hypothetical protein